jgi:hypothetical protein
VPNGLDCFGCGGNFLKHIHLYLHSS